MPKVNGRERLLLHLSRAESENPLKNNGDGNNGKKPYKLCQKGIAEGIHLSLSRTSRLINRLQEKGLVKEDRHRVNGFERRRKVYSLTPKGTKKTKNIRDELEKEKVVMKTDSSEFEVKLKNIDEYIDSRDPLLTVLNHLSQDGIVDLTEIKDKEKEIFVGRDEELEFLYEEFEKAKTEGCSTILIKGEAGIGKTKLVEKFKEKKLEDDIKFLSGKGHFESSEPFLPFKKAFQDSEEDFAEEWTGLTDPDGKKTSKKEQHVKEKRQRRFSGTKEKIQNLCENEPLVIFIDDLQRADRSSLILFHFLAENLNQAPALLIGAYRVEDVKRDDFLNEVIRRLEKEDLSKELKLEPLVWEKTKKIIERSISRSDIPEGFVELIHDTSEGNPLFTTELVKQMLEDEIVDPKEKSFPTKRSDIDIPLPKVINTIMERRIGRLDQEELKVLQVASIIGEKVQFPLLRHLCDKTSLELLEHSDAFIDSGFWKSETEEDVFSFTHGMVHLAIYESVPEPLRKRLHAETAEAMEDIFEENIEEYYSEIGYHYKRAEEFSRAYEYYKKAGEKAKKVYAHEDAVQMFKEAKDLAEKDGLENNKAWTVLEKIGDIYGMIGEHEKSLRYYESIPEKIDKTFQQRLYRKMAEIYEKKSELEKAMGMVEKGLSMRSDDGVETARLLQRKGWIEMSKGDYDPAKKHFSEALKLSEDHGNKKDMADIHHALGTIYLRKSVFNGAISHLTTSLEMSEEIGDLNGQASSLSNIGNVYLSMNDVDEALEHFQESLQKLEIIDDKVKISKALLNIGMSFLKRGDLERSYENFKECYERFDELGHSRGVNLALIQLANYYLAKGDLDNALKHSDESLEMSEDENFKYCQALSHCNIGLVHAKKQNNGKAKKHYEKSIELCQNLGDHLLKVHPLLHLADVLVEEGEFQEALKRVEKARDISKSTGSEEELSMTRQVLERVYLERVNEEKERLGRVLSEPEEEGPLRRLKGKKELGKLRVGDTVL